MKLSIFLILAILVSLGFGARSTSAAPLPLTECDQIVSDAVLVADLDCSAASYFAVTLSDGGKLDLAGHTLVGTADYESPPSHHNLSGGVKCVAGCTIVGGGGAIVAPPALPPTATDSYGVFQDDWGARGWVVASDLQISGWTGGGIRSHKAIVTNATFAGNKVALSAILQLRVDGCVFTNNFFSIWQDQRLTVSNSLITDSGPFGIICGGRTKLIDTVIANTDGDAFQGGKLRAEGSSLSGSCRNTSNPVCADILTYRRQPPTLINSTCGTSVDRKDLVSWKVCTMD